jgi:hypothetical protein
MNKNILPIEEYEIYDAFPHHAPNRPIFSLDQRSNFGYEDEILKAESILSSPREDIDWAAYSFVNQEACSCIYMFSKNFYKDIFPSLLHFCISPKNILQSGGINILTGVFVNSHLDTNNIFRDWELDFLLSFNQRQSKIVASVLVMANEKRALESYWGGYLS